MQLGEADNAVNAFSLSVEAVYIILQNRIFVMAIKCTPSKFRIVYAPIGTANPTSISKISIVVQVLEDAMHCVTVQAMNCHIS